MAPLEPHLSPYSMLDCRRPSCSNDAGGGGGGGGGGVEAGGGVCRAEAVTSVYILVEGPQAAGALDK